ncbi:MAG: response regulator transcription factor [Clostridia bacterium]|nr:response regulator transcription factor [Clostridia bacterium]
MNFVLLDDEKNHHEILAKALLTLCRRKGWGGRIALTATCASEVISYAKTSTEPTVYFLDIELDGDNSLRLSDTIHENAFESYIIYVTAHPQYAMSCLHTHAFDYLLKPWTAEQLEGCMSALMRRHTLQQGARLLQVDIGGRLLQLPMSEILYFSRDGFDSWLHRADGSSLVWRESFAHLMARLPQDCFVMCHRSYIVNISRIVDFDWGTDQLTVCNGERLPIARRRITALRAAVAAIGGPHD